MARPFKVITFWDRVYTNVIHDGECLLFTGAKDSCGYGRINRDGKLVRIHRAVWERDHGPIPDGMVVMHKCDVPACINPDHLSIGTQEENIADMDAKGRRRSSLGQKHHKSKLTEGAVKEIRALRCSGESLVALSEKYGVTPTMVSLIARRKFWKHV